MGANTAPRFKESGVIGYGQVSVANTNRDGSGTLVDIVTGAADGTLIESVRIQAIVTTTAGMIRLFIYDTSDDYLVKEIIVTAITPSGTVAAFETEYIPTTELVLPSGYKLKAATHNAETFEIFAFGGDL
jgi:hypothetical protein